MREQGLAGWISQVDLIYSAPKLFTRLKKKNRCHPVLGSGFQQTHRSSVFSLPPDTCRVPRSGSRGLRAVEWIRRRSPSSEHFKVKSSRVVNLTSDVTFAQMRSVLFLGSSKGGPYCRKSPLWAGPRSKGVVLRSRWLRGLHLLAGPLEADVPRCTDGASVGERRLGGAKQRETWERSPVILRHCNYLSTSF